MHANKLLIFVVLLLLIGCNSNVSVDAPPATRFARYTTPLAAMVPTDTPIQSARSDTPLPATAVPSDSPEAPDIPTAAESPSPTASATPAPALPLRDDLPPLALKDWPRPVDDNGLGIHFIATGYYDEQELDRQIARMQDLHLKWALVLYADENHLELAARKFKQAGIIVVWRKTLRPYQRYNSWGRDIEILNQVGMPPYMQLYNEPELPAEWEGQPQDWNLFLGNLLQATKDVYNAGGYPGIQFLDEDHLRDFISQLYARQGEPIFHRMFFIAHSYGLNHPPDYTQDTNGVLGFVIFAQIFQHRLGYIPPIIVGEGGWKVGSAEDNRYPTIDEALHRDYTLAVMNWFQSGKMSNGSPLPDYLFAFCHWMLSGAEEAGAWYDAFNGNRELTIQAVQNLPLFTREFSWTK